MPWKLGSDVRGIGFISASPQIFPLGNSIVEFVAAINILQYSFIISTGSCCTWICCFGCFTTLPWYGSWTIFLSRDFSDFHSISSSSMVASWCSVVDSWFPPYPSTKSRSTASTIEKVSARGADQEMDSVQIFTLAVLRDATSDSTLEMISCIYLTHPRSFLPCPLSPIVVSVFGGLSLPFVLLVFFIQYKSRNRNS